jgi:gluconate kinase
MSQSPRNDPTPSYVVLLSGTHVAGKETLATSLAKSLDCPWVNGEYAHSSARFGSRSQATKGYDYGKVFGRIWLAKLRRIGFLTDGNESDGESEVVAPKKLGTNGCTAIISVYHMIKPSRDAIRSSMQENGLRTIFVVMHITADMLSRRTLGAEEPELAKKIMDGKIADIQEPEEDETDIILVDALKDLDTLHAEVVEEITRRVQDMRETDSQSPVSISEDKLSENNLHGSHP